MYWQEWIEGKSRRTLSPHSKEEQPWPCRYKFNDTNTKMATRRRWQFSPIDVAPRVQARAKCIAALGPAR